MPTLQDLVYSIEANTQGLQTAFAPIEKLEKTLNGLAKSVRSLTKTFTDQMNAVAQVQNSSSGGVKRSTDKIIEQLKRQQAALINSTQKLLNLNQTLGKTGASTKAIDANVDALRELDKILKDGTISSADATLARAKFNAVLSESNRALKEVKEAQSAATSAQKNTDASLLKQTNALERVRLQYEALANTLADAGSTPMHLDAANKAFNDFAKAMSSGVLSAEEFSEAINKSNASLQMIKRGAGVEKTLTDAVGKAEEALKRQDVRLVQAKQKLDALARSVAAVGASSSLVNAATVAYDQLDKVLKDTSTSAADASLAAAKYNAELKEADRLLAEFVSAEREAEKATNASAAAQLRQTNKLADATIQFENLRGKLSKLSGTGASHIVELEKAFTDLSTEMKSGALDADRFSAAVNKWKKSLADIKRESGAGGGVSQLSDGMRELVQSAQLLLGPLSGIASRIQNLVALARAGGLAFAGWVTAGLAFGFSLYKAVIAGAAFEKQMNRINAVLETTGNVALMSGADVEAIVQRVGDATGAATLDIREAAAGLSTIVGMNENLLESALKAAQGLAKVGGGTIQSSYRNLAQALQDPANAFQTLTQYGVEFDEMEKKTITSLVNRGKKTEAVAKIMEKLAPATASATGESKSLAAAWQQMFNNLDELLVAFAQATGIIGGLTTFLGELNAAIKDGAEALKIFGEWWSKAGVVTPLLKEMKNVDGATEDVSDKIVILGNLLSINFDKTTILGKAAGDLAKKLGLTADAAAEEAIAAQRAATAEEVHFRAMENSAKNAFNLAVALKQAASEYVKLEQQHLPIITEQELMEEQTENLTEKYDMFKKVLIASGKTEEQAIAILGRLGDAIKLNTNSIENYIDKQKQAITFAQMDAQIAGSEGAAKRSLSLEQKILNDLYASGAIITANYGKSLAELMVLQPELRGRVEATTVALEKLNMEAANNAALKALNDQLRISKSNLDNARNSTIGQALALAILSKEIELLNRGLTSNDQAWKDEIAAITEITKTDWTTDLVKAQKDLEDQVKLANSAIQASTQSIIGEAKAIAVAAKEQEMLNQGVARNNEYWKEQIRLVNELVDAQFTVESNQRIKDLQAESVLQDHIMESLFQSERTRSRLVDLAQKEYELAQRYGDLQDPRAQKELALFKILQEREALLQHFQELSGAIDSMFSKAEDAIVEFAQTGKIQIEDLVRSIAEDFFRLELRYLILDPLHDMLGKGLGALAGGLGGGGSAAGLLGKGLGGTDMLFKVPLPVTIVGGGLDVLSGKDNPITKALEAGGGKGATCGCIGDALKSTSSESTKNVVEAVTGGDTDVVDAVTNTNAEVVDAVVTSTGETAIDIAEEVGGKVEKSLEELGDIVSEPLEKVVKTIEDVVPAVEKIAPAVKEGIMGLPGMDKVSTAAAETMFTKIPSRLSPIKPFSEWEMTQNPNFNADFMRQSANVPSGFSAMAQSGIFNQSFPPFTPGTAALTAPVIPQFNQQYIQDVIDRAFTGMGPAGGSTFGSLQSGIIGGGDIFGGNAGTMGADALSSINDSVISLKDTFTELSDTTTNVIDRFGEAAGSVSSFATEGIDQASQALTNFGTDAIADTATKVAETTTAVVPLGTTSTVASTQISALGASASAAAAQLSAAGAAGAASSAAKSVVGAGSLSHILPGFATGGWTGGGSPNDFAGLVHKREFVMDEEATRNLGISTLEQIRAAAKRGGGGGGTSKKESSLTQPTMNSRNPDSFKIVNVLDPGIVANYLATREGEQIIMNIMRRNNQGGR